MAWGSQNNADVRQVALVSNNIVVDPDGFYLMAAWLRGEDRFGTIGRNCGQGPFGPSEPYYASEQDSERPVNAWFHVADYLNRPLPDKPANLCQILVTNLNSQGHSEWDRIMFARVRTP